MNIRLNSLFFFANTVLGTRARASRTCAPASPHRPLRTYGLFSNNFLLGHRRSESPGFLCLLAEGAGSAEHVQTAVGDLRAGDALLLADLSASEHTANAADDGNERQDAVEQARVADLLGHLASRIARNEVGDDADGAVVEAAEQTVLELTAHCRVLLYELSVLSANCLDLRKRKNVIRFVIFIESWLILT